MFTILLAIPLFTFAGYLLSEGGAPGRLVRVSRVLLGWMPGGLAVISLAACAVFTAFTGASGVTIIALGALIIAMGMMVDNAIVVVDGFVVRLQQGMERSRAAIEAASSAGWALTVWSSSSAGPSQARRERDSPRASSASCQTAAASGETSARALPMPTV